jgi:hypothetical protein
MKEPQSCFKQPICTNVCQFHHTFLRTCNVLTVCHRQLNRSLRTTQGLSLNDIKSLNRRNPLTSKRHSNPCPGHATSAATMRVPRSVARRKCTECNLNYCSTDIEMRAEINYQNLPSWFGDTSALTNFNSVSNSVAPEAEKIIIIIACLFFLFSF